MRESLILATRIRRGDSSAGPDLLRQSRLLAEAVQRQVAGEASDLAPVLATLDSFGRVRCAQLEDLHRRELSALDKLPAEGAAGDEKRWAALAEATSELVRSLLRCLRWGEEHLLDPYTLRDDPVIADQVDG